MAALTGFTDDNFAEKLIAQQPGTCKWIERNETFRDKWLDAAESKLLFITGAPGCGKSFLARHIRDHLLGKFKEPNFVQAFFCNNTRIHQDESPIFQYFVKELVMLQPAFFHQVGKRFRTLNLAPDSIHLGSLMEILKGILRVPQEGKIFLLIDGLDECDPAYIKKLLQLLHSMFQEEGPDSVRVANVARIAILCRPSPDIVGWTSSHLHINVSVDDVKSDIGTFVEASLDRLGDERFKSLGLGPFIQDRAGDSFLWVDNIIKDLEQLEDTSSSNILDLFTRCPRNMEEYYNKILADLAASNSELVSVILEVVLWVRRPLKTTELCAAAGIALGRDLDESDMVSKLNRSCARILRISADNEVAFVHHSLRQLLTGHRDEKKGHCLVVNISLRCIMRTGRGAEPESYYRKVPAPKDLATELAALNPFLNYARDTIFLHSRLAGDEIGSLVPLFDEFLCGDGRYYRWWYFLDCVLDDEEPEAQPTPVLQTMALNGMADLLKLTDVVKPSLRGTIAGTMVTWWFWLKAAITTREKPVRLLLYESAIHSDDSGFNLLHAAALGNSLDFARLWIENTARADSANEGGFTPLYCAAKNADVEFVTLLLDWGANPFHVASDLKTPLRIAVERDDDGRILATLLSRMLLEPSEDGSSTDSDGEEEASRDEENREDNTDETHDIDDMDSSDDSEFASSFLASHYVQLGLALSDAVKTERENHVALLLAYGADPNGFNVVSDRGNGMAMLHATIEMGNDTIFDLLLDECDLSELSGDIKATPLHFAVIEKRHDYVEKIIAQSRENGLDKTYLDGRTGDQGGWPSVSLAVHQDDEAILRLLLRSDASPDTARDNGRTALHAAVTANRLSHCQALIDHGCNVNAADEDGITPLVSACYLREEAAGHVVATLLAAEADPSVQDRLSRFGPLHIAAEQGYTYVIEQLLESPNRPDINSCGEDFPTPLGWAVMRDHIEAAQLLIEKGANIDLLYSSRGTPIISAIVGGNAEMVALILRHNPNMENERHSNWTPLHAAAENGNLEVLSLMTQDKPPEILDLLAGRDGKYGTALFQACLAGRFKCAMHLVKRGCNTQFRVGQDSYSLLHASALGGSPSMLRYLLKDNVFDISEMIGDGITPLALACREGNISAATVLVQRGADPTLKDHMQEKRSFSALFWCAECSPRTSFKLAKLLLKDQEYILRDHRLRPREPSEKFIFAQSDLDLALLRSAEKGCEDMFRLLLQYGANQNFMPNQEHWPCLHMAVFRSYVGIIELLLGDERTDVLQTDYKRRTALHIACSQNQMSSIIPLLLGITRETPEIPLVAADDLPDVDEMEAVHDTPAFPPGMVNRLLGATDMYGRTALDYRLHSRLYQKAEAVEGDSQAKNLVRLRELLDPSKTYTDGDLKYDLIGKSLLFLGDAENAIKAHQMRCQWAEWEGEFIIETSYMCENCTSESTVNAIMVCWTCGDVGLCEDCHELYQQKKCSKKICAGHEFLKVPTVSEEELQANFPRPEGIDPPQYMQFARTAEMGSIWMDELRAKYSTDAVSRAESVSSLPDLELDAPPVPAAAPVPSFVEFLIVLKLNTTNLGLPVFKLGRYFRVAKECWVSRKPSEQRPVRWRLVMPRRLRGHFMVGVFSYDL